MSVSTSTSCEKATTPDFDVELMRFPRVFGLRIVPKTGRIDAREASLAPAGDQSPARTLA